MLVLLQPWPFVVRGHFVRVACAWVLRCARVRSQGDGAASEAPGGHFSAGAVGRFKDNHGGAQVPSLSHGCDKECGKE